MVLECYINPLSENGKDVIKGLHDVKEIFRNDDNLKDIIRHSKGQNSDAYVPQTLWGLALERLKYYIIKYNSNDEFVHCQDCKYIGDRVGVVHTSKCGVKIPEKNAYFFDERIAEYDTVVFYILFHTIAIKFGISSSEMNLFLESQILLMNHRYEKIIFGYPCDVKYLIRVITKDNFLNIFEINDEGSSLITIKNPYLFIEIASKNIPQIFFEKEEIFIELGNIIENIIYPKRKTKRKGISKRTRVKVLNRDNYTCQMCGRTVEDGVKLEVDHKIPVSKGGSNNIDNLQTLCYDCNRGKSNMLLNFR